ncbi:MAG: hypothetical protein HN855_06685 [Anaerolineae bacterium]|jgi:hypothetical protein|nr:hypothetical protein [Anaerolineae bacterium]MBT7071477.1 hypothetical protein [Anaerolineae bacterium]MBT7324824.1 hypothetical protein [Anaerolineae bacterium]
MRRLFNYRTVTIVLMALTLSAVAYGFAAANSVPESGAGDSAGTISGYTITNIAYILLNSDPSKVASVAFSVNPTASASAAATVEITIASGTTWVSCTNTSGVIWSCSFASGSEPTVAGAASLQVVATD